MGFQFTPNALLLLLLLFIVWSCFLYGLSYLLAKTSPQLVKWSRFWQGWLVVALIPLLPFSFYRVNAIIAEELKSTFGEAPQNVLIHSSSIVNQIDDKPEMQVFLWLVLLMIVGGSCLSVLRFFLGFLKVYRLLNNADRVVDFNHFTRRQQLAISAYKIQVFITEQPISPLVFGLCRQKMLLPTSVFSMEDQQRNLLIEHELMHIRRQDTKAVILFRLCSCLFWFNPFIRYFESRFIQSMELNCDIAVLADFPEGKLSYARALISSLKLSKTTIESDFMTCFSAPHFNKQAFEERIKQAMSPQLNNRYGVNYWLVLITISLFITSFALAAKPFFMMQVMSNNIIDGVQPVKVARVSSNYNDINDFRGSKPLNAIDFAASKGTEVVASFSGKILIADDATLHRNYGKVVLIEHEEQVQSLYAHLDSFSVEVGQYVSAGQKIGSGGSTGRTTGPHLHFEMLKQGKHTDPNHYLDFNND